VSNRLALVIILLLALAIGFYAFFARPSGWTADELITIKSLSLSSLPSLLPDKSNRVADDPRAVALGHKLFFDQRFSADGKVSCASCHMPELNFQDARAHGRGIAETRRRTQSIVGSAYFHWFFWDGRKDSQWSQALAPMEHADEQGGDRAQFAHLVAEHYRAEYQDLFGALPDLSRTPPHASPVGEASTRAAWAKLSPADQNSISRVYANLGKALAAYQRQLLPGRSRFDEYADALAQNDLPHASQIFTADERAGLKLFIGKANCIACHNTPLFSDDDFHNTGVPQNIESEYDLGRAEGAVENFADEFKCWSEYSDDSRRDCPHLRYMQARAGSLTGAFKTPSLRKTQYVSPFMHNAWYTNLREILDHYNRAPAATIGQTELQPLHLTPTEPAHLESFLHTLTVPLNTPPALLTNPFADK
jgi:cytochrome c peroxidase